MPFRIQCSHCRKYMIVEDESRGGRIDCLICEKSITAVAEPKAAAAPDEPRIRTCPKCGSRMRVSSNAARVRCPKCQFVF